MEAVVQFVLHWLISNGALKSMKAQWFGFSVLFLRIIQTRKRKEKYGQRAAALIETFMARELRAHTLTHVHTHTHTCRHKQSC